LKRGTIRKQFFCSYCQNQNQDHISEISLTLAVVVYCPKRAFFRSEDDIGIDKSKGKILLTKNAKGWYTEARGVSGLRANANYPRRHLALL